MQDTNLIAVYGSLKKGFWNYDALISPREPVGHDVVRGVMQINYAYPHLFEPGTVDAEPKTYDVELYYVDDDTADMIAMMEIGAGYYEGTIPTDLGRATIYYTSPEHFRPGQPIADSYQ